MAIRFKYRRRRIAADAVEAAIVGIQRDPDFIACTTMNSEEVARELHEQRVNAEAAMAGLRRLAAETHPAHRRRTDHVDRTHAHAGEVAARPAASGASNAARPGRTLAMPQPEAAPTRGFFRLLAHGRSDLIGWNATHHMADGLRHLRSANVSHPARRIWIRSQFEQLADTVGRLADYSLVGFDTAWPVVKTVEEAAIELADTPELWDEFAFGCAHLSARSPVVVKCMLVDGLKDVLGRGERSQLFVEKAFRQILRRDPAPEPRMMIFYLIQHHSFLTHAFDAELRTPADDAVGRTRDVVEVAHRRALEMLHRMRDTTAPACYFQTPPIAALFDHRTLGPLAPLLSLYALGDVVDGKQFVEQYRIDRKQEFQSTFIDHFKQQLSGDSASHFLTMAMFEPIRDRYPRFAARVLAELAHSLSADGCQAAFVSLAEGYERSFAGSRQRFIPRFNLAANRFEYARRHPLNVFGELVCASTEQLGDALKQGMDWMNRRLSRWLAPSG